MDHKVLTFFKDMSYMSSRWMRWWEYLSRFDYSMEYIQGTTNLVADSLSCYYSSNEPDEMHDISAYINADTRLDPKGDDLPIMHVTELVSMHMETQ